MNQKNDISQISKLLLKQKENIIIPNIFVRLFDGSISSAWLLLDMVKKWCNKGDKTKVYISYANLYKTNGSDFLDISHIIDFLDGYEILEDIKKKKNKEKEIGFSFKINTTNLIQLLKKGLEK